MKIFHNAFSFIISCHTQYLLLKAQPCCESVNVKACQLPVVPNHAIAELSFGKKMIPSSLTILGIFQQANMLTENRPNDTFPTREGSLPLWQPLILLNLFPDFNSNAPFFVVICL